MQPAIKIRCIACKTMMTMVAIPFKSVAAGCEGCPEDAHLHVRCEQCSGPGAYACVSIKRDGSPEVMA